MSKLFGYRSERVRDAVITVYQGVCQYCGRSIDRCGDLHVDHIQPVALGGQNLPENFTLSCDYCNQAKDYALKPGNIGEFLPSSWKFQHWFGGRTFDEVFSSEKLNQVAVRAIDLAPQLMSELGPRRQHTELQMDGYRVIFRGNNNKAAWQLLDSLIHYYWLGIGDQIGWGRLFTRFPGHVLRATFGQQTARVPKSLGLTAIRNSKRLRFLSSVLIAAPTNEEAAVDFWSQAIAQKRVIGLGYSWRLEWEYHFFAPPADIRGLIKSLRKL